MAHLKLVIYMLRLKEKNPSWASI